MKKRLSAIALLATVGAIATISPAMAGESARKSFVGPAIALSNGATGFGANSRFAISDNFSARPFAFFFSANNVSATVFGADLTYDYHFPKSDWTIYGGLRGGSGVVSSGNQSVGFGGGLAAVVGGDYQISDSLVLNINTINFSGVVLGAGFNF